MGIFFLWSALVAVGYGSGEFWDSDYSFEKYIYDDYSEELARITVLKTENEIRIEEFRLPNAFCNAVLLFTVACSAVLAVSGVCLIAFTVWRMYLEMKFMRNHFTHSQPISTIFKI